MVTEDGASNSPTLGEYDIPGRRRIPPRLDPLRIHPPPGTLSKAQPARSPYYFRRPPPPVARIPPPHHPPNELFLPPPSPASLQLDFGDEPQSYRPRAHSPVSPTFPKHSFDQHPRPRPRDGYFDRPLRKPAPGRPLKTSASASKLNGRYPKAHYFHERRPIDPSPNGLALPRSVPSAQSDLYADDPFRSSDNSELTSRSSFEHASGTERSSVLTKGSSAADLSPETPDGPGIDEGMSVEDAISMYLDGFSDVTEEPESPKLPAENQPCPVTLQPPTELRAGDGTASSEHSPDLCPSDDLSREPSMPDLVPHLPPPGKTSPEPSASVDNQGTKIILPGAVPPPLQPGTDSRDRYGFRKATPHTSIDQYDSWNGPYSNFAMNRAAKWSELLAENALDTGSPTVFPPKSSKVKRFVRKGIPSEYRGAAWFWYAGGFDHLNRNPGHYSQLVERAMTSPSNDDKEHIERDLHRTFPDNIHFKPDISNQNNPGASSGSSNLAHTSVTLETEMIQSLRRVLYAFSLHNPRIGYTQSLNFITGMLLLFLPEEKAFWMLHIITSIYLPGTHEVSLEGANIDLWILMVLLRESSPTIYSKIAGTGNEAGRGKGPALTVYSRLPDITLGMTNWLMSVFIGTLPLETTLRVWDVFFYEGSKTFFRVSLAIFKACEKEILAVSDPMEVFQIVQTVPKRLLDANTLLDDCFVRRHRVGQGRIDELRNSRRIAVRQEKLRRSQAFSKGQLGSATDEWGPRSRTPIPGIERSIADSWRHMRQHAFK